MRAYQLTAPFETFKDMGKQTGIIFYTQAAYTSRIDPITGWRPHLYLKYSSAEKPKLICLNSPKLSFKMVVLNLPMILRTFANKRVAEKYGLDSLLKCGAISLG